MIRTVKRSEARQRRRCCCCRCRCAEQAQELSGRIVETKQTKPQTVVNSSSRSPLHELNDPICDFRGGGAPWIHKSCVSIQLLAAANYVRALKQRRCRQMSADGGGEERIEAERRSEGNAAGGALVIGCFLVASSPANGTPSPGSAAWL